MRLVGALLGFAVIGIGFGLMILNWVDKPHDSVERP
jgi:hypothetical protein